jgi:hypothetical protein
MFEWITGNVVAFVIAAAVFGGLSVTCGLIAGYAGHKEAVAAAQVAAKANERAAEAELELQRLKTPRTLGPDRQQFVAGATKPFTGQRYRAAISQGADDGVAFWESVHAALEKAGWVYVSSGAPSVGDPPAGIPIAAIPGIEIRFDPSKEKELAPPALALGNALHEDGTIVAVNRDKPGATGDEYKDTLLIVIGARLPPEKNRIESAPRALFHPFASLRITSLWPSAPELLATARPAPYRRAHDPHRHHPSRLREAPSRAASDSARLKNHVFSALGTRFNPAGNRSNHSDKWVRLA